MRISHAILGSIGDLEIGSTVAATKHETDLMFGPLQRRTAMRFHLIVAACVCLWASTAAASDRYNFRSANAVLTVINTDRISDRTERELLCMARNVYHEARGQSEANQLAVAWVTRNRHEITGRSICSVVFEHARVNGRNVAQFSWTQKRHMSLMERAAWDQAQRVAWRVYRAPDREDITRGATHFHERHMRLSWSHQGIHKQTIGAHTFLRLRSYELAEAR